MRIAFFNWRDIRHPHAGGAEVYVHRLMRALSALGHSPCLFCSRYPGASERSEIDGIPHVRFGGKYSIYPNSLPCYGRHIRGKFDLIAESINGVPFFTPFFARERTVAIIHQLTRENWYSGLPYPAAFAGYHLEDAMLSPYRNVTSFAPSESTRADLRALGFSDVRILHGAADAAPTARPKRKPPTLIFLGRLAKSKRVDHAISALGRVRSSFPGARLLVCGSGPEEGRLRDFARAQGLSDSVEFLGRVGQGEKARLLAESHLMLFPAVREGWGLTVLEANACGTPVLGYDVPGLRDSIREGMNGSLVPGGDWEALGDAAVRLLSEPETLAALSESARRFSSGFSWRKAAGEFISALRPAPRI